MSDLPTWNQSFVRPEPMDPNDRLRQKTQSRGGVYPYDKPVSYGAPRGRGMGGDEREMNPSDGPPLARQHKTPRPQSVWDRISDSLDRIEIGPQAASATPLGYGNHGRMGEQEDGMDAMELETDSLKIDFRNSYDDACSTTDQMDSSDLFGLLTQLDPDFAAETFAPEDEEEMQSIYSTWADRMSGYEEER